MIPLILKITMIVTFNGYAQSIDVNRMDAAYYCSLLQYGNDNDAKKAFDFAATLKEGYTVNSISCESE